MCHRPKQILRLLQLSAQHNSEDDDPLRVVDPNVVEVQNIQGIIAPKTVRVFTSCRGIMETGSTITWTSLSLCSKRL